VRLVLLQNKKCHVASAALAFNLGGGGGGGSGRTSFPTYMENYHYELLNIMDGAADRATTFLGPNMVLNGGFEAPGPPKYTWGWIGWEAATTGWNPESIGPADNHVAKHGGTSTKPLVQPAGVIALEHGVKYYLSYEIGGMTLGTLQPFIGSSAGTLQSTNGFFSEVIESPSSDAPLFLAFEVDAGGVFNGWIDNVTLNTLGSSPYTAAVAHDPSTDLAQLGAMSGHAVATPLATLIDNIDEGTTLESVEDWVARAQSLTDGDNILGSDYIDTAADAYELSLEDQTNQAINRFAGSMVGANACAGSAFVIGLSIIEKARLDEVAKFRASLELQKEDRRIALIDNFTQRIMQTVDMKIGRTVGLLDIYQNTVKYNSVLTNEQTDLDTHYAYKDALFDLELMVFLANAIGAPGGSTQGNPSASEMNKRGSVLGGAVSGLGAAGAFIAGTGIGMTPATAATATAPAVAASLGPTGWAILGIGAILGAVSNA